MTQKTYLPLLLVSLLAACSSSDPLKKEFDYKSDVSRPKSTLETPPDLTTLQQQNRYQLPSGGSASLNAYNQATSDAKSKAPVAATSGSTVVSQVENARIERAGTQRWLAVDGKKPEEIWPLLKAFWQDSGFTIKSEEPDAGVMETDWAENRAKLGIDPVRRFLDSVGLGSVMSTPERDMFRIRLERTASGTEVYFSHRGMYETYINEKKDETRWQPRPSDPNLESAFLARFMVRLGSTEEQATKAAKAAVTPNPAEARAKLVGNAVVVQDDFDRAWRRVGLALDRIGLIVTDRDRSRGVYYVRPAKNDADKKDEGGGFWSNLAFWKSSDPKKPASETQFQVQLKTDGGLTSVQLLDDQGKPVPDKMFAQAGNKLVEELK